MDTLFNVEKEISLSERELEVLNTDFETWQKQFGFKQTCDGLSTYHDANNPGKLQWHRYEKLVPGKLIIARQQLGKVLSSVEALDFMSTQGGFGLTRDNLFMAWILFWQEIWDLKIERIQSVLPKDLLPVHPNGGVICPMLEFDFITKHSKYKARYDWCWFERDNRHMNGALMFFQPTTT